MIQRVFGRTTLVDIVRSDGLFHFRYSQKNFAVWPYASVLRDGGTSVAQLSKIQEQEKKLEDVKRGIGLWKVT